MKNNNDAIIDKALDAVIDEAANLITEEDGAAADAEAVEFSREHQEQMKQFFRKERQKRALQRIAVNTRRVACVLLIAVGVMSVAIMGVEALRIRFLNFFFDSQAPDTAVEFSEEKQDALYEDVVELKYIPEGFELTKNKVSEKKMFLHFDCEDKYFQITVNPIEMNSAVNTQEGAVENISINNYEGIYIAKNNVNTLVWHDGVRSFRIMANMEQFEIIKIAENIKLK